MDIIARFYGCNVIIGREMIYFIEMVQMNPQNGLQFCTDILSADHIVHLIYSSYMLYPYFLHIKHIVSLHIKHINNLEVIKITYEYDHCTMLDLIY